MIRRLLALIFIVCVSQVFGQDIAEQKETVAFVFGTIHPQDQNGRPMKTAEGKQLAVEMPLGTAFFVVYPDARLGADSGSFTW